LQDTAKYWLLVSQLNLKAIRLYPANQALLYDLLTLGSTISYQESWIESHKIQLTQLTEYTNRDGREDSEKSRRPHLRIHDAKKRERAQFYVEQITVRKIKSQWIMMM
jgi:hypothetical protein